MRLPLRSRDVLARRTPNLFTKSYVLFCRHIRHSKAGKLTKTLPRSYLAPSWACSMEPVCERGSGPCPKQDTMALLRSGCAHPECNTFTAISRGSTPLLMRYQPFIACGFNYPLSMDFPKPWEWIDMLSSVDSLRISIPCHPKYHSPSSLCYTLSSRPYTFGLTAELQNVYRSYQTY